MPDPIQYDFLGLTKLMSGKDCLKQWDVMTAYDNDAINKMLLLQAQKQNLLETITLAVSCTDPINNQPYIADVTINISDVYLQFPDTSGQVNMICPFTGGWQARVQGAPSFNFPANIQLNIATSLKNVKGTVVDNFAPAVNPKTPPVGSGYPVTIDPGDKSGQGVCLDLTDHSGMVLSVEATPGAPDPGSLTNVNTLAGSQEMTTYLKNSQLSYFFAGVSNTTDATSSLQPMSFCFTVGPGDSGQGIKPALCTWISLGDTPGDANPEFTPTTNGAAISPLPKGCQAAVYFSHDTIANKLVKPQLATSYDNVLCTSVTGQPGMTFTWQFPSTTINIPQIATQMGDPGSGEVDAASFDLNQGTNTLTLGTATEYTSHAGYSLWAGPTLSIDWSYDTTTIITGTGPSTKHHTGVVEPTFDLEGTVDWVQPDPGQNVLKMSVSYDKNFTKIVVAKQPSGWDKWVEGETGDVPPGWANYAVAAPEAVLDISVDYFLTTNLLMPGACLFTASDVSQQGSTVAPTTGISTPRDTFLTGTLNL